MVEKDTDDEYEITFHELLPMIIILIIILVFISLVIYQILSA